ncbi:MAG: hypothetical protein KME26_27035 [Oscillatoria princeps RMCB-10]|nr:hypothetical protein [Oscillatoria princeps RMCB-10]
MNAKSFRPSWCNAGRTAAVLPALCTQLAIALCHRFIREYQPTSPAH